MATSTWNRTVNAWRTLCCVAITCVLAACGGGGGGGAAPPSGGGSTSGSGGTSNQPAVSMIAGTLLSNGGGVAGYADGPNLSATFTNPGGLAVDGSGNLYVSDLPPLGSAQGAMGDMREISSSGTTSTVSAGIYFPYQFGADSSGNLYGWGVSAQGAQGVVKLAPSGAMSIVLPLNGQVDGYPVTSGGPVTLDSNGNIYMADVAACDVIKLAPGGTPVITAAGMCQLACSYSKQTLSGIAVDSGGNTYLAVQGICPRPDTPAGSVIYKVTPGGTVTTFAGNMNGYEGDGTGPNAGFFDPFDLVMDDKGNLFTLDSYGEVIREITPQGVISSINPAALLAAQSKDSFGNGQGLAYLGNNALAVSGYNVVFKVQLPQ
jgi:hypothetical protein